MSHFLKSTSLVCHSFFSYQNRWQRQLFAFFVATSAVATAQTGSTPRSIDPNEPQLNVSAGGRQFASKSQQTLSIPPKVVRYAHHLIAKHDLNGDGVLQKAEWQKLQGHPELIDLNADGAVDRDELTDWIADYGRRKRIGVPAVAPLGASTGTPANSEDSVEVMGRDSKSDAPELPPNERRRDLKFFVPAKRLPQGLPEWFLAKDLDGDGQLTTGEFSPSSLAAELEDFAHFDANGDGVLTAKECVRKSPSSK